MGKRTGKRPRGRGSGSLYKRGGKGAWIASWHDHDGRRRDQSTRTTDRAAAERILAKKVADAALRREGVIDANTDRYAAEGRRPIGEHVAEFIADCRERGQADRYVQQKEAKLGQLVASSGASRLTDLTADRIDGFLVGLREDGLSARSVNHARAIVASFMTWCVRRRQLLASPMVAVGKQRERPADRRSRRALTDEEIQRLLEVAEDRGRAEWYLTALLSGLRRGEMLNLRWADIDWDGGCIRVVDGKSRREEFVPLHPLLSQRLSTLRDARRGAPGERVFPTEVTNRTRRADFERAGIPSTDDDGKVADLHALRTTLGTRLAQSGVPPQIAQRLMRHADYRTTLNHYTALTLADTAAALQLAQPVVPTQETSCGDTDSTPQLIPQQMPHEQMPLDATGSDSSRSESVGKAGQEARNPASAAARRHSAARSRLGVSGFAPPPFRPPV